NSESNQKNKKRQSEELCNASVQSTQGNKKFKYSNYLKPIEYCDTAPVHDVEHCKIVSICDIKYDDLKDLKFGWKGGFGDIYKGIWKGRHIAAKFVRRETSTELKDFDYELAALRISERYKSNIIQFFRLSQGLSKKREIGIPMQYIKIYEECWSPDSSLRSKILKILNDLKNFNKNLICTEKDIPSTGIQKFWITEESSFRYHSDMENLPDIVVQLDEACQVKSFYSSYYDNIQLNKRMCNKLGGCIIEAVSKVEMLQNQVNYNDYDELLA
ncbi:24920_t:CDS:2, partial [Racocetra persica]